MADCSEFEATRRRIVAKYPGAQLWRCAFCDKRLPSPDMKDLGNGVYICPPCLEVNDVTLNAIIELAEWQKLNDSCGEVRIIFELGKFTAAITHCCQYDTLGIASGDNYLEAMGKAWLHGVERNALKPRDVVGKCEMCAL